MKMVMSAAIDIEGSLNNAEVVCENMEIKSKSKNRSQIIDKLQLRFLQGDDIATLKILCNDWFPIKYPDSWYKLVAIDKRFFSLVATLEEQIIAILIAEIKPRLQVSKEDFDLLSSSFKPDTKVAYILSLGVHKAYRRQGIASYLLHNFLSSICAHDKLSCQEVKAIYLHVLSTNKSAIQFYEQHKFKLLHFLPSYYVIDGTPKDGYSYVLHINGGKPPVTIVDCFLDALKLLSYFRHCCFPSRVFICVMNIFRLVKAWPNFSPFISRSKQCCTL